MAGAGVPGAALFWGCSGAIGLVSSLRLLPPMAAVVAAVRALSHVLTHGLQLLTSYLAVERHNAHLARWLATEEDFARQVFGADYEHLLLSLFGNDRERLYLMAARDFLNAGRRDPALSLLARARDGGNLGPEGLALLQELECAAANAAEGSGVCAACSKKNTLPCLPYLGGQGRGCA